MSQPSQASGAAAAAPAKVAPVPPPAEGTAVAEAAEPRPNAGSALAARGKRRRMIRRVMSLVVLCALGGGGWYGYKFWQTRKARDAAPRYLPVTVARADILVAVQATGTVQPENRIVIKPPINGRIDTIKVEEGAKVRKGQILGTMSSTDRAALLDVARAKGAAEVRHWEDIYRPTPIVAPLAGVVIQRATEPGQTIAATDSVFVISDHLLVVAQVDETDMARVQLGQNAQVGLDAYPGEKVTGKVHRIAFEAKTVNNVTMYDVQIDPEKVPDFMRSGMTASVQFKVEEHKNVVAVPSTLVHQENGRTFVLKKPARPAGAEGAAGEGEGDGETDGEGGGRHRGGGDKPEGGEGGNGRGIRLHPDEIPVTIGLTDGRMTEITSGVAFGDTVLETVLKLPDAAKGSSPFGSQMRPGGRPGAGGPAGGGRAPGR